LKLGIFEALVGRVVDGLEARPELFDQTALFVTFDKGGGYWESGLFRPIDFFGDSSRIPLVAVSRFSRGGRVVHTHGDRIWRRTRYDCVTWRR
jgi:phospholipase C